LSFKPYLKYLGAVIEAKVKPIRRDPMAKKVAKKKAVKVKRKR